MSASKQAERRKRRTKRLRKDDFSVMCRAIGRYLGKQGWNVVVIGDAQVRSWDAARYTYVFAMKFTGTKMEREEQRHG